VSRSSSRKNRYSLSEELIVRFGKVNERRQYAEQRGEERGGFGEVIDRRRLTMVMCNASHRLVEVFFVPGNTFGMGGETRDLVLVRSDIRMWKLVTSFQEFGPRTEKFHSNEVIWDELALPTAHYEDRGALVASCQCGEQRVPAPPIIRMIAHEKLPPKLVWDGTDLRSPRVAAHR
jgi:hypothetical protein